MKNYKCDNSDIQVANGQIIKSIGIGNLVIDGIKYGTTITISGVLHCPDMDKNLISLSKLQDKGTKKIFKQWINATWRWNRSYVL